MLNVGDRAPDFEALDQHGEQQSLSELLARGDLILYFYPADFTPVCTAEACAFRDSFEGLQNLGVQVVGVSPQGKSSHRSFTDRYELPFPLLCDENKTLIKAFGVNGPLGFGVRRATFLIGQDGVIKNRVVADLLVASHKAFIEQVLDRPG